MIEVHEIIVSDPQIIFFKISMRSLDIEKETAGV